MRIFTLPPTVGSSPEPNFYDSLQKVRLRQQLEMYSLGEHVLKHTTSNENNLDLGFCSQWLTGEEINFTKLNFSTVFCHLFLARKFEQQQGQTDSVQLSMEWVHPERTLLRLQALCTRIGKDLDGFHDPRSLKSLRLLSLVVFHLAPSNEKSSFTFCCLFVVC